MQLGSPNLTYKCSTMSPGNPFIFEWKGQKPRSVIKAVQAWIFALLRVLAKLCYVVFKNFIQSFNCSWVIAGSWVIDSVRGKSAVGERLLMKSWHPRTGRHLQYKCRWFQPYGWWTLCSRRLQHGRMMRCCRPCQRTCADHYLLAVEASDVIAPVNARRWSLWLTAAGR